MSTVQEIKQAIESLTPAERIELERLLLEVVPSTLESPKLPDQAERRKAILGDRVLPNLVLEARSTAKA
jgi:hypothetical protein